MNREDELQGITDSLWKDNKELQTDLAEACDMLRNVLKENKRLKETLRKVLKSKQLVLPKGLIKAEHWDEAAVLLEMYTEVEQVLKGK